MKTRVAIVLHGLSANGIDTLLANLSDCWDKEKFDITYFLAVDEDDLQFWEQRVVDNGVRVVHITDLDGKKLFKWPKLLYKNLKQYGPFDAIHVNMDMLNGINLAVAKRVGIKVRVCHAHTSSNAGGGNFLKTFFKKAYLGCMKFMINRLATQRVACSDVAGEYFFGKHPYKIIYNGINLANYARTGNKDSQNIKFITVGRISEPKNPFLIVDIIKALSERMSDFEFDWIGTGDLEPAVKQRVKELSIEDKINFLGVRDDVNECLVKADYFLLPSKYEGLSLALAEAQAAGLNCFVSDTVSKLSDCGKCYFISLQKTPAQWADEICDFIKQGRDLPINTEKLSLFDIRSVANQLQELYSQTK